MLSLKKLAVLAASVLCWIGLPAMLVQALGAMLTLQVRSYAMTGLVVAACVIGFGSFYTAYRKSRAAGAASFADLYEDLAFRFCLTPMLTLGAMTLLTMKMA